jgi:hypothetical protein
MNDIVANDPERGSDSYAFKHRAIEAVKGLEFPDLQPKEIEFLEKLNKAMVHVRILAKETFSLLADQLPANGVARAVESAASTHATLGGNLATAADGVARAVESAASTHATLGGNLATAADGVARAVESAASTHATLGGNLATAADGVAKAIDTAALPDATFVEQDYVNHFRNLVLTMLGELPRKGHLTSDFDEMFHINFGKHITRAQFREMGDLMSQVKEDWTSDDFLKEPPVMLKRMRMNLLKIAEILDISERIPSTFNEDDLEVIPHISLLNDFLDQLLRKISGRAATYRDSTLTNLELLEPARQIIKSHRDAESPLPYKILRTAFLENTAQARIQGLRTIADVYGLGQHPYLTTHDIVEGYHGRDSLEQLQAFVHSSNTPVETLEAHLDEIMGEVSAFYASMSQCVQSSPQKLNAA